MWQFPGYGKTSIASVHSFGVCSFVVVVSGSASVVVGLASVVLTSVVGSGVVVVDGNNSGHRGAVPTHAGFVGS